MVTPFQVTPSRLRDAHAIVTALVGEIDKQAWARPTPCEGWTVRDLVNHLVVGNLLFAGVLGGRGTMQDLRETLAGDHLGNDPAAAFAAAADALAPSTPLARCSRRSRFRSAPSRPQWCCTCGSPRSWSTAGTWRKR